jgi:signal transduction histidine kinase
MTALRPRDVRGQSVRVALGAAGVVAITYIAISVVLILITTTNLTKQVDDRLTTFLANTAATGSPYSGATGRSGGTGGTSGDPTHASDEVLPGSDDRPFGPPILTWRIAASGPPTYIGPSNYSVDLPVSYASIGSPETVSINGSDLRMAGRQVGSFYYVAAQTLASVSDARATLILTEALIAPFLLLAVFFGAVVVGRRVATPIEQARQRQLEFTADASHELRTPLSVIEAHTSLALAQDRSNEWYRTAFARIDDESQRMRNLLDDLLWLARFDATQVPANNEPVDVGVLAEAAADRFGAVAEARFLTLRVNVPNENHIVTAPAEWLDRLVGVLVDNACKYSPDGGSVAVGVASERGRIVLTVDDSGPGIPEAERSRIFDRFHRATDVRSGAGLGLAIGDAIVRATGGHWRIGTAPSGGARMSVSWPRSFPGARATAGSGEPKPSSSDPEVRLVSHGTAPGADRSTR